MSKDTALLIVDVQVVHFVREKYDGKKLFNSEQLLNNINTLIEKARNSDTPIIYVQYTEGDDSFIAKGTPLWEIHPQIKPKEDDMIILKYHADPFYNTSLHEKLKALGVNKLVITGVQTEFCVDTTCRCAFSLGYKNVLVSDGHSTYDSDILSASQIIEHHNRIIGGQVSFAELKETEKVEF
ncbi:cysteine hydrolase family protein [Clostridium aciditolerans]|uniref:Cysteine hydrolase n=1 Tax=Clostridium aciditolerans TaxID=339861 RepID=A0A934HWP9_9CLOT|nr:cysteine hydrolase family protein [Clostridium aciditolerans]MBI6872694.1 cysteine hydrolase [Clostridium aciditolerans]